MHKQIKQQAWQSHDLKNSSKWITVTENIIPICAQILNEVEKGYGVFLVRGLPIQGLTIQEIKEFYFQLGLKLGTPVFQDPHGIRIADIRSTEANYQNALHYQLKSDGKNTRPYETNAAFSFHTDPCDVAGLLCIHNAIAEKDKDLLSALYECFYYVKPPQPNKSFDYHQIPIFSLYQGHFKSHVVPELIRASQTYSEVPRLNKLQVRALEYLEQLANDSSFYYELTLSPGDLLLVNNHVVYHVRNSYQDGAIQRHLLRLWLAVSNSRPLDPIHQTWFGDTNPGAIRGGYWRNQLNSLQQENC
jgi:hypothetical protein